MRNGHNLIPGGAGRLLLLAVGLAWALLPGINAASSAPPELKVHLSQVDKENFPLIRLYVDVERSGERSPAPLTVSQFKVYEDNRLVNLSEFLDPSRSGPLTTVLVLDCSGSMRWAGKMAGMKEAANCYLQYLKPKDRVGLITFDHTVTAASPLTEQLAEVRRIIAGLAPGGRTAFYDAVHRAAGMMTGVRGRKVIVAITDGMDNSSSRSPTQVVELSRQLGVPIYTIGLGQKASHLSQEDAIHEEPLQEIARDSGGHYFFAPTAAELVKIFEHLSQQFKGGYELTYSTPNPRQDGTTRLVDVEVTTPLAAGKSRNSYYIPGVIVPVPHTLLFLGLLLPLLLLAILPGLRRRRHLQDAGPLPVPATPEPESVLPPAPAPPVAAAPRRRPDHPQYLYLVPLTERDSLPAFPLVQGENLVGSGPDNDVVIPHPSLSPRHARITWRNNRYVLTDLYSREGTAVRYGGDQDQERSLGESALQVGSVVRFGDVFFRVSRTPQ